MRAMQDLTLPDWRPELSVGNALLDKQHAVLLKLAAALVENVARSGDEAMLTSLGDILLLAERHCAAEEHLLMLNGFEWMEQHSQDHRAGLERLRAMRDLLAHREVTREQACSAVVNWMVFHLEQMDLPARDHLGASGFAGFDDDMPEPGEGGFP